MSSISKNLHIRECKVSRCRGVGMLDKNGKRYFIKGYCAAHYAKLARYGVVSPENIFSPRQAIVEGNIAKIPLGFKAKDGYAIVDKRYKFLADDFLWHIADGYARSNGVNGNRIFLHHLIIGKPREGLVTDHINRDRLDNRSSNLRHITQSENVINSGVRVNNKSGYKNVSWSKVDNKWVVSITRMNKLVFFYKFNSLEKAILARDYQLSKINTA